MTALESTRIHVGCEVVTGVVEGKALGDVVSAMEGRKERAIGTNCVYDGDENNDRQYDRNDSNAPRHPFPRHRVLTCQKPFSNGKQVFIFHFEENINKCHFFQHRHRQLYVVVFDFIVAVVIADIK